MTTTAGPTVRIGVTGPIGCGKSTVAGWLTAVPGVVAVDADAVAREVLAPGSPAVAAVAARFGSELVDADGVLDRAALGRIVFTDPGALRDLESIVHPAVRPRILAAIEAAQTAAASAVVIEAIKLVEGGLATLCDEVWLVTCDPGAQRDRLAGRGLEPGEAAQRMAAQAGMVGRLVGQADRVIDTSGRVDEVRVAVIAALDQALSRTA